MKLSLTTLQKFRSDAAHIKTNPIIPILSYIKFENGNIIKNNLREFIIQECDGITDNFLIDEKILFNFLSVASGDISFKVTAKKITITDGNITVTSPTEDITQFPTTTANFDDLVNLNDEVLSAIGIAAKFITEDETNPIKSHVFIGNDHVAASDGFIAYLNNVGSVPAMVLDKLTAQKIGSLPVCFHTQTESYNFFCSTKTTYGFIRPEQKFFDLSPMLKVPEDISFSIKKDALIKFNEACITSSPAKSITSRLEIIDGVLVLTMKDADYSIDVNQRIPLEGNADTFGYNPTLMNRLLKAVPDSDLKFYQGSNKYFIKGSNFTSLIMELV